MSGRRVKALDALWADARFRLYQPRHVLTWLRLKQQFDLRFVRFSELTLKMPIGAVPDCAACENVCCTGPDAVVSLRLRDIATLLDADLGHAIGPAPSRDAWQKGQTAASSENAASWFYKGFPALVRDKTGTCTLLGTDLSCTAHPHWPVSCARYPYALNLVDKTVFWARGCEDYTVVPSKEAPAATRALLKAVVDSYNERIKDLILVHVAPRELHELGLLDAVTLPPRVQKRLDSAR